MKKILLVALLTWSLNIGLNAQETEAQSPQETGRAFMRQGDFDNAILVFTRLLQQDSRNTDYRKDLVMSYFYKRDYARAKEYIEPLLESDDVDMVAYQLGGNIFKALEEVKEAEKMYKRAIKKFPSSGALYKIGRAHV